MPPARRPPASSPPALASSYINPIIAVILGVLVAAERFDARSLLASVVVLAGVAVVRATAPNDSTAPSVKGMPGGEPIEESGQKR